MSDKLETMATTVLGPETVLTILIRRRDRDRTLLIDKQTLRYVLSRISALGWIYPGDDSVGRISFGSCKEFG